MADVDFRATEEQALGGSGPQALKAIIGILLAELNVVRAALVPPLPPLTRAQLVARLKAALR
jgi:hypothetical protein